MAARKKPAPLLLFETPEPVPGTRVSAMNLLRPAPAVPIPRSPASPPARPPGPMPDTDLPATTSMRPALAVPVVQESADKDLRPTGPAPAVPTTVVSATVPPSPLEFPRPAHKALARAIFLRSTYPDPEVLERTVAACCDAIRHERPPGRPWVDRQRDVILVGRLGPTTATSTG